MKTLLLAFALLAVATGFKLLGLTWSKARRQTICQDYCNGEQSSTAGAFNFVSSDWALCSCPTAQATGFWATTSCYSECVTRCVRTFGLCAFDNRLNLINMGTCCTTAKYITSTRQKCFAQSSGACYQAGSGGATTTPATTNATGPPSGGFGKK